MTQKEEATATMKYFNIWKVLKYSFQNERENY